MKKKIASKISLALVKNHAARGREAPALPAQCGRFAAARRARRARASGRKPRKANDEKAKNVLRLVKNFSRGVGVFFCGASRRFKKRP